VPTIVKTFFDEPTFFREAAVPPDELPDEATLSYRGWVAVGTALAVVLFALTAAMLVPDPTFAVVID